MCIDVVIGLAGLVFVLVLAHVVDEKMSGYDTESNMLVLCCCAEIVLLSESCGERKQERKERGGESSCEVTLCFLPSLRCRSSRSGSKRMLRM